MRRERLLLCCDPLLLQVSHAVGRVRSGAATCLDFSSDICCAGHGYSLLLEAEAGGTCHRLGAVSCVKRTPGGEGRGQGGEGETGVEKARENCHQEAEVRQQGISFPSRAQHTVHFLAADRTAPPVHSLADMLCVPDLTGRGFGGGRADGTQVALPLVDTRHS